MQHTTGPKQRQKQDTAKHPTHAAVPGEESTRVGPKWPQFLHFLLTGLDANGSQNKYMPVQKVVKYCVSPLEKYKMQTF